MKKLLVFLFLLATVRGNAVQEDGFSWMPENALLVVLDISGSMAGSMLDNVRGEMDRAFNPSVFPANGTAGLISFSGCSPNDVRLEVPLAKGAAQQVLSRAHSLQATGSTDIFSALLLAKNEAQKLAKSKCVKVMVLTDGFDSCGVGDLAAISAEILRINECNQVNTVALGTEVSAEQALKGVAKAGQGEHRTVADMFDLEEVFWESLNNLNSNSKVITGMRDWQGDEWNKAEKKKSKRGNEDPDKKEEDNTNDGLHTPNSNANTQHKTRNK